MTSKFFFFICFISLLTSCKTQHTEIWDGAFAREFRQGSGQRTDPYLIASTQELAYLAKKMTQGESFDNVYFLLTQNLDMNGQDDPKYHWPIGLSGTFNGKFDGGSNKIKNVMISIDKVATPVGLFGTIGNAGQVENLVVDNAKLPYCIQYYAGAIAGINEGVIVNCQCSNTSNMHGGIAGKNLGKIVQCKSLGTMTYVNGGITGVNHGTIEYCLSQIIVPNGNDGEVGGICGTNYGKIAYCAFTGKISGERFVGGIAGSIDDGVIENCYNTGTINAEMGISAGGVVGYGKKGAVINCYNAGYGENPIMSEILVFPKKCYFDVNNYSYYRGRRGANTTQFMKSKAFVQLLNNGANDEIWGMDNSLTNNGYPIIKKLTNN